MLSNILDGVPINQRLPSSHHDPRASRMTGNESQYQPTIGVMGPTGSRKSTVNEEDYNDFRSRYTQPSYAQRQPSATGMTGNGPHSSQYQPMIAVMGPTGSGKSTFIHRITGDPQIKVGHTLSLETAELRQARYHLPPPDTRYVTFVDTPGFDDSTGGLTDADILQMITAFLQVEADNGRGRYLTGIIYLHALGGKRVGGSQRRNIKVIKDLLGEQSMKNVVIVMTQWENHDQIQVQKWDEELRTDPTLFEPYIAEGAGIEYMRNTDEAVFDILQGMLSFTPTKLQIQDEMDKGLSLLQTTAGSELEARHLQLKEKYEVEIATLRKEMADAKRAGDAKLQAVIAEEREKAEADAAKVREAQRKLREKLTAAEEAARRRREKEERDAKIEQRAFQSDFDDLPERERAIVHHQRRMNSSFGQIARTIGGAVAGAALFPHAAAAAVGGAIVGAAAKKVFKGFKKVWNLF